MTPAQYKFERQLRGTQVEVAALLGVKPLALKRRENGGTITREAALALLSLPTKHRPNVQTQ